jgi:hypothetical protein
MATISFLFVSFDNIVFHKMKNILVKHAGLTATPSFRQTETCPKAYISFICYILIHLDQGQKYDSSMDFR